MLALNKYFFKVIDNMRYFYLACVVLIVVGCNSSGGGSSTTTSNAPPIKLATISGVVFASGIFTSGVVNAYSYKNGIRGDFLSTSSINALGIYTLNVAASSGAILIEVGNGCYTEKAIPWSNTSNNSPTVALEETAIVCNTVQKLSAVLSVPFDASTLVISLTPYTHAAVGLADYLFRSGSDISTAISDANSRISSWVGVNIQTTLPTQLSRNTTFNNANLYSSLISGIPSWFFNKATALPHVFGTGSLTTANFASEMKSDLAQDGILNGTGRDADGNPTALSIGSSPLTTTIYRHQLAFHAVIRIRAETGGAVSATLDEQGRIVNFLPSLTSYNDSTNSLLDNSAIVTLDEGGPAVSITSPSSGATLTGNQGMAGIAHDSVGIAAGNTVMLIDGVQYVSFVNQYIPNNFINTTIFSNGPHTLTIKATNNLGHVSTASVNVTFSN